MAFQNSAQKDRKSASLAATAQEIGQNSAGNTIYRVHVDAGGRYTATTGPSHPAGGNKNVLFGDGIPGTTFNTVRSYTTSTDYTQRDDSSPGSGTVLLGRFASMTPIGATGFRTTYALPGPPTTPDALTITQDVNVIGTTFENSTIEVTTTAINNGSMPVELGIRYLWDYQIAVDDGPTFQELGPDGAVRGNEAEFQSPRFAQYRIVDNDANPRPPTFFILGTTAGPVTLRPEPTPPDVLQFTCWPRAQATLFDYAVNPAISVVDSTSGCGGEDGDSAVLYYFGRNRASAFRLPAGGKVTVSASMFLTPTGNTDQAVTQTASPNPVAPGSNVTYTIRVTNLDGQNAARFVTVTDNLTPALSYVACSATGGGVCSGTGNNRTITFSSLPPGASETITLVAQATCAETGDGTITNTVNVSSSMPDRNPGDNSATTIVNLTVPPERLTVVGGKSTISLGTIPAARELNPNPPADTFTIENSGCGAALLNFAINRTGADVTGGRIINADDSALFPLRLINANGTETPIPTGPGAPPVQVPAGQRRNFRLQFNPLIPILAGKTSGLFANQVLPDVITSQLTVAPNSGAPLVIDLVGRIATPMKMIHPTDSRLAPLILFSRAGDVFTIQCSTHDSNQDLYLARYQFLDQNDRTVGFPADVDLLQPIAQRNLVRGQSFTIIQTFTGASSRSEVRKVRVTLFDRETSVTEAPAVLGATEASLASVSAASFSLTPLASESIVSSFGGGLASGPLSASTAPLPTSLAGVTVRVRDGAGMERSAPLFFVSPGQINYQVPAGSMVGAATVTVWRENLVAAREAVQITNASPGLFSANANGQGAAAAVALRISRDGRQQFEPVTQYDPVQKRFVTRPLDLGPASDQFYLVLFGTGARFGRSPASTTVKIGGVQLPALYAGAQGSLVGLDQINVAVPRSLAGRGEVDVTVTVDGKTSNPILVKFGGSFGSNAAPGALTEVSKHSSPALQSPARDSSAVLRLPVLKLPAPDRTEQEPHRSDIRPGNRLKEK
jgi:uncharacterized protein (TIGR03437 family)